MAWRFARTPEQRRELAQLFARVIGQIGEGAQAHKRLHAHLSRYETTAWPRERNDAAPRDPRNAPAHAILKLYGRTPGKTFIDKILRGASTARIAAENQET
jgi:hypothetical protein